MTLPTGHKTTLARASVATKVAADGQSILDVASGAARFEKAAVCGAVAVTARGAYAALAVDTVRDWLLCQANASGTALYVLKTADGTPELVKDLATVAGHVAGHTIRAAGCNQGNWFVWMGVITAQDGVALKCRLLKSTDEGATWAAVKTTTYGPCAGSHMADFLGDLMVWGTYTIYEAADGYAIFLSRDKGENWETVMEVERPAAVKRHSHGVIFDGPDRLYAVWGDMTPVWLERYDYAGGVWTATQIFDPTMTALNTGNEGLKQLVSGEVLINSSQNLAYNPGTGLVRWFGPWRSEPIETGASPYRYMRMLSQYNVPICHIVLEHAGVLYAPIFQFSAPAIHTCEGVIVSPDNGDHWVQLFTTPTFNGIRNLVGPWKGLFWALRRAADGAESMCSFPPACAALVNALRVEAGATNQLSLANSTFTAANGTASIGSWLRWWNDDDCDQPEAIANPFAEAVHGAHVMKGHGLGTGTMARFNPGLVCSAAAGDRIVMSAYVRAGPGWPKNYGVLLYTQNGTGTVVSNAGDMFVVPSESGWLKVVTELNCTVAGTFGPVLRVARPVGGDAAQFDLYADAVQIVVQAARHFAASAWQPGGTARADESATVSLAGYSNPWSVLWDWRPGSGWAEYAADVPIASFRGAGGTYIDLSYQVASGKFLLSDGTHTALSAVVKWRHFDTLRFSLSTDGTDSTLRISDPVGPVQEVAAAGVAMGAASTVVFGTDNAGAAFGAGLFHSLALRHEAVSAAEFAQVVARPGWSFNRPLARLACVGAQR